MCRAIMVPAMSFDTLVVARGEFSIEDPWAIPPPSNPIRLRRATDGNAPRLSTTVAAYYDDDHLNIVFSAADDHIVATFLRHDEPVYDQDVVEVFLAPDTDEMYYEIDVSPIATVFDARITSPDGIRKTMRADPTWKCDGLLTAVRKVIESDGTISLDIVMRIPFPSLGRQTPLQNEIWRANFFRIDRHPACGDEYSAWRPSMRSPADFHVVSTFGSISFQP
jgi:cellulose/xylan binding protein with CBM9 domain